MKRPRSVGVFFYGLMITAICLAPEATATIPYSGAGGIFPGFGPGVIAPPGVGGKEYSHDFDSTTIGAAALSPPPADAEQIIAWDGVGGTVDVTDFSGTRPMYTPDDDVDAIAHHRDFAYEELHAEASHLLFSLDDRFHFVTFGGVSPAAIPAGTPPGVTLGNGNVVGGSGEISYELGLIGGNPPDTQGLWAAQSAINGMPLPDDIDGLEVWGPEPPLGDADKYSLDIDIASFGTATMPAGDAVSIWNASGTDYLAHSAIVGAVTSLLGPIPASAFLPPKTAGDDEARDIAAINLDALMVQDTIESPDLFEPGPGGPAGGPPGPGDEIIFSIRQIVDPMDPDGFYATGSELFVLNAGTGAFFLAHGGHLWDHAYSVATFGGMVPGGGQQVFAYDINAIEAVGEFAIPEPASVALLLVGLASVSCLGHRRG